MAGLGRNAHFQVARLVLPLHLRAHGRTIRDRALTTRLIDFCWWLFQWTLVLMVAAALVAGGYLYFRMDHEIARHVQHLLAKHYQQLDVRVGSARFEQGRGIAIFDVTLAPPPGQASQPLLSIDEMFLECDARLEQLLTNQLPVKRLVLRRGRLHGVRQPDGQWNVATLLPLPRFSDQAPEIVIEDATLIVEDSPQQHSMPLAVRGIDVTLTPVQDQAAVQAASLTTGTTASQIAPRHDAMPPPARARRFHLAGTASGLPAQEVRFAGEVNADEGSSSLRIETRGLEISPELFASLPGTASLPSRQEMQLYGRANLSVRVQRAGAGAAWNWSASMALNRGRLNHVRLPRSLTEMTVQAQANQDRLIIQSLTGKLGSADVALACERRGWGDHAPLSLAGKVADLPLDDRLQAALPESLARSWRRFQPTGNVDAEVRLTYDGSHWQPGLVVQCRDVSLTDAEKFPYPLEHAAGTLELVPSDSPRGSGLRLNLLAHVGARPVRIEAEWSNLFSPGASPVTSSGAGEQSVSHPVGLIDISGSDVTIDERLLAALPQPGQRLARSLRPEGKLDFHWRLQWAASQPRPDKMLELMLKDCSIRYDLFPYPLDHVRGRVTAHNGHWELHDVVSNGRQGATTITCRGESLPEETGRRLQLVIQGTNLPLDDNLRNALSEKAQKAWAELRPHGQINFTANVRHQTGQPKPQVDVVLEPFQRSVSIEPKSFPYRLEQLDGHAAVSTGRVDFKNIRAHHGRVALSTDGTWQATEDGGWRLLFNGLNVDRLSPHRDLIVALPPGLQKVIERLQPTGTFALYGSTLSFVKRPDVARLISAWDVQLVCHQAALRNGIPLENITGGIRLNGRSNGAKPFTAGELEIDSVTFKEMQFTDVRGPLWADETVCLLGRPATERNGQPQRPFTAQAYGGTLTGDVRLQCDGPARYDLSLALGGADLVRFATERLGGPASLSGTVSGRLNLSGTGRSTHALNGTGQLYVVDGNIYKLPVLVSLLKVLQIRAPDTTAFHTCDMLFSIQGEHIHFQRLNLLGDAVSLYGRGETNFDRRLNLVFYSLMGPAQLPVPLLNTIVGEASQQILQLKVTGTMSNPNIEREAFPAVNQVLQQIQAELQEGASNVPVPPTEALNPFTPQKR